MIRVSKLYRKKKSGKTEKVSTEEDFVYISENDYKQEIHTPVVIVSREEFEDLERESPEQSLQRRVEAYVLPRYIVDKIKNPNG